MNLSEFSKKEEFISYEELTPIPIDHHLNLLRSISKEIISESNNKQLYESINSLRRLKKFNINFFNFLFDNLYKRFVKLLSSRENKISLISFVLLNEIFIDHENTFLENWVMTLLPKLIKQCVIRKYLTVNYNLYENIANNFNSPETLMFLFKQLSSGSMILSNSCYYILRKMLQKIDGLHLFYFGDWNNYFNQILMLNKMSKIFYKNKSISILKLLNDTLGNEIMIEIIQNLEFNDEEKKEISIMYDQMKSIVLPSKQKNYDLFRNEFLRSKIIN